jgi:low molecular weight protein-tyrosine phosphatase
MKKVLFVCLGNICRSPLAEALFRKHTKDQGLDDAYYCDSCGTAAFQIGAPPDERSVENALQNGLVYTNSGRQLSVQDFDNFDYIIAMDDDNYRYIVKNDPAGHSHIYKLRKFDSIDKNSDVSDPYFGGSEGFQHVYDIINRSTLHLLAEISKS